MLIMSYSPIKTSAKSVCHLIYKNDRNDPIVKQEINAINSPSSYVIRIGEHLITDARFYSFDHYVLHGTSEKNISAFILQLKQNWKDRLARLISNPKKTLIVHGNAVKVLGKNVFLIDRDKPYAINLATQYQVKVTMGLDLIPFTFDVPFDQSKMNTPYMHSLVLLSNQQPIYLFDANTVYKYNTKEVSFGKLYVLKNMKLTVLRQLPDHLTQAATEALQNRQIGPARVFYSEQEMEEDEKKARENTKSVSPEELKGHKPKRRRRRR